MTSRNKSNPKGLMGQYLEWAKGLEQIGLRVDRSFDEYCAELAEVAAVESHEEKPESVEGVEGLDRSYTQYQSPARGFVL